MAIGLLFFTKISFCRYLSKPQFSSAQPTMPAQALSPPPHGLHSSTFTCIAAQSCLPLRPALIDHGALSSVLWGTQTIPVQGRWDLSRMILSPPQGLYQRSWGPSGAPPRRGLPPRASGLPEGPTTSTANADVLARIKAARQYKDSHSKPVVQQPQSIGAAAGVGSAAPLLGTPETKPEQGSQGGGSSAADAVLARIMKAKEYKQQPASPAAAAAAAPEQQQQQLGGGIEQASSVPTLPEQQQPIGGQAGNTQQAAGWLQSVVAKDQPQVSVHGGGMIRMTPHLATRAGPWHLVGTGHWAGSSLAY
jgi:hypothetical protein